MIGEVASTLASILALVCALLFARKQQPLLTGDAMDEVITFSRDSGFQDAMATVAETLGRDSDAYMVLVGRWLREHPPEPKS